MSEYQRLNLGPAVELGEVPPAQNFVFYDNKQLQYRVIDTRPSVPRAIKSGGYLIDVQRQDTFKREFALSEDKVHIVKPEPIITLGDLQPGDRFKFKRKDTSAIGTATAVKLEFYTATNCGQNVLDLIYSNMLPIRVGDKLIFAFPDNEVVKIEEIPF